MNPARRVSLWLARLLTLAALLGAVQAATAADAVTRWSSLICSQAIGDFDPFVSVLMHAAMHDALNAIDPRYARWTAPAPDEPPAASAAPEAAVAAAAYHVLMGLQADKTAPIESAYAAALASMPDGPSKRAGLVLGKAVAAATLARRAADRDVRGTAFSQSNEPGRWRATPPDVDARPRFGKYEPFSGAAALDLPVAGPQERLDSPRRKVHAGARDGPGAGGKTGVVSRTVRRVSASGLLTTPPRPKLQCDGGCRLGRLQAG
jgi:hypothetical protein